MERFITDERTGINYELIGDYYLPCLKAPYSPPIGRYGKLRHRYLKQNRRVLYSQLLTSGKLGTHLAEIDSSANDMMKWVDLMNNIRASAEEIVFNDLIYA